MLSNKVLESQPTLKAVVASLDRFADFRDERYTLDDRGEFSQALIGQRTVVKVPRVQSYNARRSSIFEALVMCALNESEIAPPLVIPNSIQLNVSCLPYYAAKTLVPGEVIDEDTLYSYTENEKQKLGAALGGFIGWMGQAMSLATYAKIASDLSSRNRSINAAMSIPCQ